MLHVAKNDDGKFVVAETGMPAYVPDYAIAEMSAVADAIRDAYKDGYTIAPDRKGAGAGVCRACVVVERELSIVIKSEDGHKVTRKVRILAHDIAINNGKKTPTRVLCELQRRADGSVKLNAAGAAMRKTRALANWYTMTEKEALDNVIFDVAPEADGLYFTGVVFKRLAD